ncbi:hypothetical protein MM239_14890 [Belliella sp. DSM 111904]|uniref:Uncharacterized protein n=1 Tax=Belliella filtrata TaxID=2923435 RepID=A0ABS9V2P5_9BACT|nr:hypothetical protein [Belliella filtrata]MCH7410692.1 hypothetical protein [Belliella filtrata]
MLPALGLVLGATMALAFSLPQIEDEPRYGTPDNGVTWYDVTEVDHGGSANQFQCDSEVSATCLYSEPDLDFPILGESGNFAPGSQLTPIPPM